MNEQQLKYYQDYVIPKMPNVDHTPAIEFISNLIAQLKSELNK